MFIIINYANSVQVLTPVINAAPEIKALGLCSGDHVTTTPALLNIAQFICLSFNILHTTHLKLLNLYLV